MNMNDAKSATPADELELQICSTTVPKNEREWWAHREIQRLREYIRERELLHSQSLEAAAVEVDRLRADAERLRGCRDELREVTEAMDDPAVNNTVTLKSAICVLRAERDVWRGRTICADDERDRLRAEVERLRKGIAAVSGLIAESSGVYGLHMNGDCAPWDELLSGGRFEEWLTDFDAARGES